MNAQLLYLAISLAGIAAMVGLCVVLFGRGIATLDPSVAEAEMGFEVPGFRPGALVLSQDRRAALIEDARNHALYIIAVRGDGYVIRPVSRASLKSAARDGAALSLRFSDFTFPRAAFALADERTAQDWEARLKAA
jgi:hypothetical protein